MRILSLQVGRPESFAMDGGERFETSIFKKPVAGPIWARSNALEGDQPADKQWHGGKFKAVYSYAAEHYVFWMRELKRKDLPFGMFGENLTTAGLDESTVAVGDRYRVGEALLEAVTPRIPCETLGFRFKDPGIVKKFIKAGRMGVYYKIVEEGKLGKGDAIQLEKKRKDTPRLSELASLYAARDPDPKRLRELLQLPELPPDFRGRFKKLLK